MRLMFASLLSASLALSPVAGAAASMSGSIEGVVSVSGRPVRGVTVSMVEVASGRVTTARSGDEGHFAARVAPGEYIVTAQTAGLGVASGPSMLRVAAGAAALARLDLSDPSAGLFGSAGTPAQGAPGDVQIIHDPFSCFVSGKGNSPVIDATFDPADQVFTAEVYFSSGQAPGQFYKAAMAFEPDPSGNGGVWKAILPWPTVDADPMTYYILANGSSETEHYPVHILAPHEACDGRTAPVVFGPTALAALAGGGFLPALLLVPAAIAGTTALVVVTQDQKPPEPPTFAPPPPPTTMEPPPPPTTTTTLPPPPPRPTTTLPPPPIPPVSPIR